MRLPLLLPALLLAASLPPGLAQDSRDQPSPPAQTAPDPGAQAEVKLGTGIEAMEVTGAAAAFKVAPDTRIYAWAKVSGVPAGGKVDVVFLKDGKERHRYSLEVKRSPYRTNAFRTFRKGDGGAWTAKVFAGGKELGSASFTVDLNG